jgi:transposase
MDIVAKIEKFHQLKAELRKGARVLIVGVDAGKSSSKACFYTFAHDVLLKKFHVAHTQEGFTSFIEKIEHLKATNSLDDVIIGFEPTSNYHKLPAEYLRNFGYYVVYVSSVAVKSNRKTLFAGRWGKNDPRDAYNVVDLMRQGKILFYRDKDGHASDMRAYLVLYRRLIKARSALKARVRNDIWACYFPELDELFSNVEQPDALYLLEHFMPVKEIRTLSISSFTNQFVPCTQRQYRRRERLLQIWQAAQTSVGFDTPPATAFETRLIARDIRQIQKDLKEIELKLDEYCNEDGPFRRLLSMPGFGTFVTVVFKACIEDIDAFQYPRQLLKLAGIDVESMTSGRYAGKEKISKKGMSLLRGAVCQAVNIAVSRNKQMRALFQQQLQKRGGSKQAKAKLKIKFADRFMRTAFALLKNDQPFDFKRFNVPVDDPVLDSVRA